MIEKQWKEKEKQLMILLRKEGLTFREIAEALCKAGYPERTSDAVRGAWGRHKDITVESIKCDLIDKDEDSISDDYKVPAEKNNLFDYISLVYKDEIDYKYRKALNEMEEIRKKAVPSDSDWDKRVGSPAEDANIKVVSLSDVHIPFHNNDVINHLLENHSDADVLVLNGDFLEVYSVSSWPKNKTVMLRHEYEIGMKFLRLLAEIFPKIVVTKGNHEDRLQRYFASNLDQNVSFMTSPDLLDRMTKGYDFNEDNELEKMYQLDNVHYNKGPLSWMAKVGKCIFAHPTACSGIPMRTVVNTANYFASRDNDFEALCIGHTHRMGTIIYENRLLIEQGCACVPLEYEASGKIAYKPQSFGYAVMFMDKNGHVDFNKSGTIYCGSGNIIEQKNIYNV